MQSAAMADAIFAQRSHADLCDLFVGWRALYTDDALIVDADHLKDEQFNQYLHDNLKKARRLARALTLLGRVTRIPYIIGLGMLSRADARRQEGQPRIAMALFRLAAATFRAAGLPVGMARAQGGLLISASDADAVNEGDIVSTREALDILRTAQEPFWLANVLQNLALTYRDLGDFTKALATWDEALVSLGRPVAQREQKLQAMIWSNQALTRMWQGDLNTASTLHSEARALFQQLGEKGSLALVDLKQGIIEQERGRLAAALRLSVRARDDLRQRDQTNLAALAQLYHARILMALNRYDEAIVATTEALGALRQQQDAHDLVDALCTHAQALACLGDGQAALQHLADAEQAAGGHAHPRAFRISLERAALFLRLNQAAEARAAALDVAERTLTHEVLSHHRMALLLAAEASLALGQVGEAQRQTEDLLRQGRDALGPEVCYRCELLLARVVRQQQPNAALPHYDAVVNILGAFVAELAYDRRSDFLQDKDELYLEALTAALDAGQPEKALAYLEQQRARSIWLVTSGNDAELETLRSQHRMMSNSQSTLAADPHSAEAAMARRKLKQLEQRITERLAELATRIASSEAVDMPTLRAAVPARGAVVAYALTRDELVTFVLTRERFEVARSPHPQRTLERSERHLRQRRESLVRQMSDPARVAPLTPAQEQTLLKGMQDNLRALWDVLLGPVAPLLPADDGPLVVAPHGMLHEQPFAALFDGARYAAERWAVYCVPSCQALLQARPTIPSPSTTPGMRLHSLLALGYTPDEDRLPQVKREVERIQALSGGMCVTGKEATGKILSEQAENYAYLHIAAHGAVRRDVPYASFVELADGQFFPLDVLSLPLQGRRLVVLSACETGLGVSRPGDDQVGLVRAFGLAGAQAVLATLWRVNDAASRVFMELFYERLAVGATPEAALRAAQQTFISGAAGSIHRHPYYWAGFQLTVHGAEA